LRDAWVLVLVGDVLCCSQTDVQNKSSKTTSGGRKNQQLVQEVEAKTELQIA